MNAESRSKKKSARMPGVLPGWTMKTFVNAFYATLKFDISLDSSASIRCYYAPKATASQYAIKLQVEK